MFFRLLLISSLFLILGQSSLKAQKDDYNIPSDLGKQETTILIMPCSRDKITESMSEIFEKNYGGKFQVIYEKFPTEKKYSLEKFRFAFVIFEEESPGYWVGRERFPPTTNYRFGLVDRTTGQIYKQDFLSGNYIKGGKNYVRRMEEVRKANAGN